MIYVIQVDKAKMASIGKELDDVLRSANIGLSQVQCPKCRAVIRRAGTRYCPFCGTESYHDGPAHDYCD